MDLAFTSNDTTLVDGNGGVASRAIDGNTSGVWGHGSVTHTSSSGTRMFTLVLKDPVHRIFS